VTCLTRSSRRRGRIREERGTALVELALVLPLLLVLILGMVEFGRAFTAWIDETHLANMGARLAAVSYCPDPINAPPVGDCGWVAKGCPVTGAPQNACLAWWVSERAALPEIVSGTAGDDFATAQNAAQICVWYPDAAYAGDPTGCKDTCGASPSVQPRPGDRVQVTVVSYHHWFHFLTHQINLSTTRIVGRASMRLEAGPGTAALAETGCYPASPAGS
jgi:hypothetical protein